MALHPNFSVTDLSAIHIGSSKAQKTPEKTVEITRDDDVSRETSKKSKGFSFFDMLDVINPLQHIPIVSSIYRHFTGDELHPAARVAGGALFGGPIGAALSGVDAIVAQETGQYVGDRLFANIIGGSKTEASQAPEMLIAKAEAIIKPETPSASFAVVNTQPVTETSLGEDDFLFEDFTSEFEEIDRERKLMLARENYLKSLGLATEPGAYVSQLQ